MAFLVSSLVFPRNSGSDVLKRCSYDSTVTVIHISAPPEDSYGRRSADKKQYATKRKTWLTKHYRFSAGGEGVEKMRETCRIPPALIACQNFLIVPSYVQALENRNSDMCKVRF